MIAQGGWSDVARGFCFLAGFVLIAFTQQFVVFWHRRRDLRKAALPNLHMRELAATRIMQKFKGKERKLLKLEPQELRRIIENEAKKLVAGVNRKERRAAERRMRNA